MKDQTPAPKQEKTVRVYNRGSRSFIHGEHKIVGASFAEVPESVAKNWMKLFPNDVIEAGVAQKELGGLGAELAEVRAQLAATTTELVDVKAKLALAEAALAKRNEPMKGGKHAAADQV